MSTPRALFGLFVLLGFCQASGCSACPGVSIHGRCEAKCEDSACASGAKCFDNACSAPCGTTADCPDGQACHRAVTDHGTTGSFCVGAATPIGGTEGAACAESTDCAERYGYRCVSGACTFTCLTHGDCGARGSCTGKTTDAEGHAARLCKKDSFPRGKGQYGTRCTQGTECDCPKGKCTATTDYTCVGAGAGDIDAYCTKRFCADDTECPSGFYCAAQGAKAPPCSDVCGLTGDATIDCVPDTDIGDGKPFQCGPTSLFVNLCVHRDFCSPCTSDVDCLGQPNQVCAKDESGEKICTVLCDPDLNSCPWGNAATCGVWDATLGVPTCEHRFGSCHGTGKPCEPCVEQGDCPGGFCTHTKFSGERFCVDTTLPACTCSADVKSTCPGGGCPESPGHRTMTCYGGSDFQGTPGLGLCIGAQADASQSASKESCWPNL